MLRLCVFLIGAFSGLIVLAVGIGHLLPAHLGDARDDPARYFDICTLPCFAGIVPGVTDVPTARRALALLTESRGSAESAYANVWVYSTQQVQIHLSNEQTPTNYWVIDSIQQPTLITLGDTLLQLGVPSNICNVPINPRGYVRRLTLVYRTPQNDLALTFDVSRALLPQTPALWVTAMWGAGHSFMLDCRPYPWYGFGTRSAQQRH